MPNHEKAPSELSGATPSDNDRHLDFHPGMGMRWEITRSTEDTAGELFEATNWVDPHMPGPPVHWRTVRAGETATVPAGVPHTLRNASAEPARIVNIHRPAQQFESFFRGMHSLIQQGKIKRLPPKEPRSAIYAAMLFGKYPQEIRTTKPPNGVFKSLAFVGRALRFKL